MDSNGTWKKQQNNREIDKFLVYFFKTHNEKLKVSTKYKMADLFRIYVIFLKSYQD